MGVIMDRYTTILEVLAKASSKEVINIAVYMYNMEIKYKSININGLDIFYREAGTKKESPTIVLLHGFPTSSAT
jgi:hypothetical protein